MASVLQEAGLGTLLFDLLTEVEGALDARTAHLRFDIELLAERLAGATEWAWHETETASLAVGYFGASTGAAAALRLVAKGLSDREISRRLPIEIHTVKGHVRNIMEKLALHTRLQITTDADEDGAA